MSDAPLPGSPGSQEPFVEDIKAEIAPLVDSQPTGLAEPTQDVPESAVDQALNAEKSNKDSESRRARERSDSEAETVVLSGKEDGKAQEAEETIKVEEIGNETIIAVPEVPTSKIDAVDGQSQCGSRKPSLKRKRGNDGARTDEGSNDRESSHLSSTISSPVLQAHSSKGGDSKSDRSRSSPPLDENANQSLSQLKRQRQEEGKAETCLQEAEDDRASIEKSNGRGRRETRSATHHESSTHQSESPPRRGDDRGAKHTQPYSLHEQGGKKRRKPAPLHMDRRRKPSEELHAESDDSSSTKGLQRLPNLNSNENNAMSPAKISHKKNRDRNGRTRLARSVTQGVAEARSWIKERPQDLNVPDNAGNTPLQIASLEGVVEIVQLLLEAGCDTACKNIDSDTPLIDAVENGHLDVVRVLLKAGLDPRQSNAVGKEPIDLINPEHDDGEEIRAVLLGSKREKETMRRKSDDRQRNHPSAPRDLDAVTASGPSPTNSTRSPPLPPQMDSGTRRRTARSQPTNDNLLWVNPTPQRLREAAGRGDLGIVDHILKMTPKADTETILAAARGGHDVVLGLLLAIAQHEPDPSPLRSGDYKSGHTTPMLAAIGRGNINVINLLLDQPGFDPTRRLYRGLTYYEIAKERQGSDWQQEHDALKAAFDNHKNRKSNGISPRKVRKQRIDSRKSSPDRSSSPHEMRKQRRPGKWVKDESDPEAKRRPAYKGTAMRRREGQESPAVASDRDIELPSHPKSISKEERSGGDVVPTTLTRPESTKPKRKLISGNDFRTGQELKRRASITANISSASPSRRKSGDAILVHDKSMRKPNSGTVSQLSTKKAMSEEPALANHSPGKKRLRTSLSPQRNSRDPEEPIQLSKRQRVRSPGDAPEQNRDHHLITIETAHEGPGSAMVANVKSSPTIVVSPGHGAAPVAFMGGSTAPIAFKSPTDSQSHNMPISPITSVESSVQQPTEQTESPVLTPAEKQDTAQESTIEMNTEAVADDLEQPQNLKDQQDKDSRIRKEETEERARAARKIEEARLEAQREAEEAARQLQFQRDAEEARVVKKKRDEEIQKRRLEQEKLRKEEQQQRRRELEEREKLRRLRIQQEEEQQRRASLPNGLRRAAELGQEEARAAKEILRWLPLRTVTTRDLQPGCEEQVGHEQWLSNIQAAPLLANTDLGLSQYTAWTRLDASSGQHGSLWRQLRNPMSQANPSAFTSSAEAIALDNETRPKFLALKVFWLKLSDFMDIVPRHPHLANVRLSTRDIILHEFPFGKSVGGGDTPGKTREDESIRPTTNGNMPNGYG